MNEFREEIKYLIDENVSSIQIMSDRTGMSEDDVVALIQKMLNEGLIKGRLSKDGRRFFREEAKVSDRPIVPAVETPPPFMRYDTRPGKVAAFFGLLIIIFGAVLLSLAQDFAEENIGTTIIFFGAVMIMLGCYQIGRRNAP